MRADTGAGGDVSPIFTAGVSPIVGGELVVRLNSDAQARVTENIPPGPTLGIMEAGPPAFGIATVDKVLSAIKTLSVTRLHPSPSPTMMAMDEAVQLGGTFRVRVDPKTDVEAAAARLAKLTEVDYAEPAVYREASLVPNDPSYAAQWGLAKINCPTAWDRTTGSASVVVAVLDTGIDLDHPELAPLILPGTDMVDLGTNPTPPPGWRFEGDFSGRDNNPQDEVGHGTHVAGTIACLSNNATGVAGVTWNCRLLPVKVLTRLVRIADGRVSGIGSSIDIADGIRWAVDNGARVLSMSLGGPVNTQVERDAVAYAIAQGAVVVAAMGNDGTNNPSFPAGFPDVVAVGAINPADQRAAFSQTGPHIDVVAPGVGILSTVWDNGFATYDGTSMATPHVSGVAALIISCNANLTGAQVADILRNTARPLRDNLADPVPNDRYGHGCVDAAAAVARACPRILSRPTCYVSQPVFCRSRPITCFSRPIGRCISIPVVCSRPISCVQPSKVIRCPSEVLRCTQPVTCAKSLVINCPVPSAMVRCPSGPICGIERPDPGQPFPAGEDDPSAAYDWEPEDWSAYDPYAPGYEGESESC